MMSAILFLYLSMLSRIYEKQMTSYVFPGDSNNGVPYIHFDDLTDMILLLVNRRKEIPKDLVLLCCEEDSISYRPTKRIWQIASR